MTDSRRDTPAAAFRLAIFALVRLKAYAPLASVVLDAPGSRASAGGRSPSRCSVWKTLAARPALIVLLRESSPVHASICGEGLGSLKDPSVLPLLVPLVVRSRSHGGGRSHPRHGAAR